MQIHNDIEQGSLEWHNLRAGIPTASCFEKILTATGKASTQGEAYANQLLAETMTGGAVESWEGNQWSKRGNELEPDAVLFYEMQMDVATEKVGFVTNYGVGCSPDRFVGDDGLLEIKCPSPQVHVKYLLKNKMVTEYIPQVQGQLYVTGRKWCDFMAYHPEMPPLIIRVERDEEYITKLSGALGKFLATLEGKRQTMVDLGHLTKETA